MFIMPVMCLGIEFPNEGYSKFMKEFAILVTSVITGHNEVLQVI